MLSLLLMNKGSNRRILPFVTEFIKFSTGFAVIVAAALISLHLVSVSI
jgi:hypothetical protein